MKISSEFIEKISSKYYLIIPVLGLLIYFQTLSFDFVNCDDHDLIKNNFNLISSLSQIPNTFTRSYMDSEYYRPIVNISFIIDAQIGGQNPAIYHFTNIVLHIISALLLFNILLKLRFTILQTFLATLIFTVHPLFVNAIAWIPGRNDLLFGMFSLIAFLSFLIYFENKKILYLIIHSLAFLFAVLSKETALLLPLLLVAYILLFIVLKEHKSHILKFLITWLVIDAVWVLLRTNASLGTQFNETGLNALLYNWGAIFEFMAKFILSTSSTTVLPTYYELNIAIGILVVFLLILNFIFNKRIDRKKILFGFLWFLIFTFPGMMVKRMNAENWNDYLDCRAYLPAIGLFIVLLANIPIFDWTKNFKITLIYFLIFFVIFTSSTILLTRDYANPFVFYQNAVEGNPNRAQFQYQFAKACIAEGKNDLAEKALKDAIKAQPKYAKNYYNLGAFLANSNPGEAIEYLNKTISMDSNYLNAYEAKFNIMIDTKRYLEVRQDIINAYQKFTEPNFLVKIIVNDIKNGNYSEIQKYSVMLGNQHQTQELANLMVEHGTDLYESGKKEFVETVWNSALALDSANKFALENLFQYYLAVKPDFKKAEHYYLKMKRQNIAVNPEHEAFLLQKLNKN